MSAKHSNKNSWKTSGKEDKIMSKVHVTKKALLEAYPAKSVFQCSYCDLQFVNWFLSPTYYTSGVYGWNFDGYTVEGFLITTGYRGMFGKRLTRDLLDEIKGETDAIYYAYTEGKYEYDEACHEAYKRLYSMLVSYNVSR